MNQSQFQKAAGISAGLATRWFPHTVAAMEKLGIIAATDQTVFVAQVGHESAGLTQLVESFNYSAAGLNSFVCAGRLTQGQTSSLGRRQGEPSLPLERQRAIASLVYSKRVGNNRPTNDWLCHGRGLIQITDLNNYRGCGSALKIGLVKKSELLTQDEYAAHSAAWFYAPCGCLRYPGDLAHVTQITNSGQNGIDDRRARSLKAKAVLVA